MAIEYEDLRSILRGLTATPTRERLVVLGAAPNLFFSAADLVGLAHETGYALAETGSGELNVGGFARALGFESVDTVDVSPEATLRFDLQQSVPADLHGRYDAVVDCGTVFWCSDPGAALRSTFLLARPGALIVHIVGITGHFGRGYYNIHPLLIEDFYRANGATLLESTFRTKFSVGGGVAGRILWRLGVRNSVARYTRSGHVYVQLGRANRIAFGASPALPREPNLLPNNVIGVFVVRKGESRDPVMPVRSAPFSPHELEDRR